MKKILVFLFVIAAIGVNAQTYSKKGYRTATDTISNVELTTLKGVTGNIQTQLNNRALKDSVPTWAQLDSMDIDGEAYVDSVAKLKADSIVNNRFYNYLKSNGQPKLLGFPMFSASLLGGGRTMTDGAMYLSSYKINKDTTITNLKTWLTTAGAFTSDNYNGMVVYTTNATGITLASKTADDGNVWKTTAGTLISKDLETPVVVTKDQIIMIGALYNSSAQTTAPTITSASNSYASFINLLLTDGRKLGAVTISVTTPAASYTWANLAGISDALGILPY